MNADVLPQATTGDFSVTVHAPSEHDEEITAALSEILAYPKTRGAAIDMVPFTFALEDLRERVPKAHPVELARRLYLATSASAYSTEGSKEAASNAFKMGVLLGAKLGHDLNRKPAW